MPTTESGIEMDWSWWVFSKALMPMLVRASVSDTAWSSKQFSKHDGGITCTPLGMVTVGSRVFANAALPRVVTRL